jgi:hypothetical protein
MKITLKFVLIVLGIICFIIAAFKQYLLPKPQVDFFALGWAFIAAGVLLA